ncbi:NAD(P)-binding protein [bacterium]|nr:NAD(P)-binding protein [bacterium]
MKAGEAFVMGSLTLDNRILMAPVKTGYGTPEGCVTDRTVAYFHRRAQGGAGALISEPLFIDRRGREHPKQLGIAGDDHIEGLARLVSAIHDGGSKAIAHLNHAGRGANPKASGMPTEAPSAAACPATGVMPEVMSAVRVHEVIDAWAHAAGRAKQAGFDAVEVQFGLGYLVAQFAQKRTNQRTDEFGISEDGVNPFGDRLLDAIRATVGPEYPILVRLSASEQVDGGWTLEDAKQLVRRLQTQGVAALHIVTGSVCDSPPWYYQHMALPPGVNQKLCAELKRETALPVIVAGRMDDPDEIETVLRKGVADAVGIGRALVADPDLPRLMLQGRTDEIARCGHCLQGCLANVKAGIGIGCIINPTVGHESVVVEPAAVKKRIVVVGGGPAGLQAAITLRERGHDALLFEASDHPGGQFDLAFLVPGKGDMEHPYGHLPAKAERLGVQIWLNVEAGFQRIDELQPDEVVIATGSTLRMPSIPGLEGALNGEDLLLERSRVGKKVLIIGGGLIGIESAELLAPKGHEVTIVELLDDIARDMEPVSRKLALKFLQQHNIPVYTGTQVLRFEGGHALFQHGQGPEERIGPFDTVVVAVGAQPRDVLSEELLKKGYNVHVIGDAKQPRRIYDAVREGWETARLL